MQGHDDDPWFHDSAWPEYGPSELHFDPSTWPEDEEEVHADGLLADHELADYGLSQPSLHLDIPFVPSDDKVIAAMLDLAGVGEHDLLYDLGCGDGRIVVAAALQRGARGVGIDLDPERVADAMHRAYRAGVADQVIFHEDDLLEADFADATVVCLYLLESVNLELRPRLLQELRPGTRIVSHAFDMGDWLPDRQIGCGGTKIYKWTVPAPVAGSWSWRDHDGGVCELELAQKYQTARGRIWMDGAEAELLDARVHGDQLILSVRPVADAAPTRMVLQWREGQLVPVEH